MGTRYVVRGSRGPQGVARTDIGPYAMVPLWLAEALRDEPQGHSALAVWVALHKWVNHDTRVAWPSVGHIAKQANQSERTTQRAINLLCHVQAISVKQRRRSSGGDTSNEYFLYYSEPVRGVPRVTSHRGDAGDGAALTPVAPLEPDPIEPDPEEPDSSAPAPTDISSPTTTTNPAEDQMRDYDDGSDIRPINQSEEDFTLASRPGTPALRLRKYFEREWLIALGKRPRLSERVANVATPVAAFQKALKDILRHSTEEQVRKMMDRFFLAIVSEQKDVSSEYPLWRQFLAQRQGTTSTAAQPRRLTRNVPWDK